VNTNLNKILEVKAINKNFDGNVVLKEVSAEFERGKVYAIIGPNGAGKTTLLNIINGFLKPDRGSVFIKGKDVTHEPAYNIARSGVGRLFQDIRNFPKMRVMDNLLVSKKFEKEENPLFVLTKTAPNEHKRLVFIDEAKGYLKNFGISEKEKSYAEDLSYGQEKLLSLNRLLMGDFDIFLLDEPVAGVNPKIKKIIYKMIKELAKMGKLVIIVEHEMESVKKVADFVYFISEGEIKKFGTSEEILQDKSIVKEYIGIQSINENYKQKKETLSLTEKENILSAKAIYAGYNKIEILHGVDIEIKECEIVGLIGPNGAGKSTLLKVLAGVLPIRIWMKNAQDIAYEIMQLGNLTYPLEQKIQNAIGVLVAEIQKNSRTKIIYENSEITMLDTKRRVKMGLGYLIQGGVVFKYLTIDENLTVAGFDMNKDEIEKQKDQLYELFEDLGVKRNKRAGLLSGGERQMLSLAMILMKKARTLLLLDEPSSGLSPKLTQDLLQKIREIRDKLNISILLVEQKIGEVLTLADRIYIMKGGEIIVSGISPYKIDEREIETIYMGNHNGVKDGNRR